MNSLAQAALPTINNFLDFILIFLGLTVFIWLLYKMIRTKDTGAYLGMPSVVVLIVLGIVLVGGSYIDISSWAPIVATIIGFLIRASALIFIWPYFLMVIVSSSARVINLMTRQPRD